MKRNILVISILAAMVSLSAEGAGGVFSSYQTDEFDGFVTDFTLTSGVQGLDSYGGFGYGVDSDGTITGGFGIVVEKINSETEFFGAFGGLISGYKVISSPINLMVASWSGVGVYDESSISSSVSGLGVFEELSVEIGLPVTSWFMPSVYAGYQWIIPLTGMDIFTPVSASPVVGIRLQWGAFK